MPCCPDDGVSCISAGAVPSDHVSAPTPDSADSYESLDALSGQAPLITIFAPTQDGDGNGVPARGRGGLLRALLQNFRC